MAGYRESDPSRVAPLLAARGRNVPGGGGRRGGRLSAILARRRLRRWCRYVMFSFVPSVTLHELVPDLGDERMHAEVKKALA